MLIPAEQRANTSDFVILTSSFVQDSVSELYAVKISALPPGMFPGSLIVNGHLHGAPRIYVPPNA
jgi:hypothetical protein